MTEGQPLGTAAPASRGYLGFWLVVALAAAVRLWKLGSLPSGMFRDEAEKAVNGWFLLNGGVDHEGHPWPLFIKVFGVTTSALYQYACVPFMALGGLNEWTARLPAAVAGIGAVVFTWLWCRKVWGKDVAVWAAGLLAISPWAVPLSRWAQQGVFLPLLFSAAAWGVAVFLEDKGDVHKVTRRRTLGLCGAAAALGAAMYAYDPARLFAPLLGIAAGLIWWRRWKTEWKQVLAAAGVFLFFALPVLWLMVYEGSAAQVRFRFLSVFQPGVTLGEGLWTFFQNYLSHLSPGFLLLRGDEELRHSGGVGMLNAVELAGAIAGAIVAVRRRCRWGIFCIAWIVASVVPASLTRVGVPHALRSQMALPAWQMLAAIGITGVVGMAPAAKRKMATELALLAALLGAVPFFWSYFGSYRARSAPNWQFGVKESLEYLGNPAAKDATVFFHNVVGAEFLVAFYEKMDRKQFRQFVRGQSRFKLMPFQMPDRGAPGDVPGPTAWVTPPGYDWPEKFGVVPITVPGYEEMGPVSLIILDEELIDKVAQQSVK